MDTANFGAFPMGETEAKVQVDRRQLEAMITGESPGESAETFFARVERLTGVRVSWPSRLKIRAKTKKDPFVKLAGKAEAVQRAAEMIGAHLQVKRDRVSLKMEISHCLHSQIIGRGGRNTQQIMRDTGCHIHFPDSNKTLGPALAQPKNDQVSISGEAKDVERARERLRAIGPLAVSVSIQLALSRNNLGSVQPCLDPAKLQRHFPQQNGPNEVGVQFGQPMPSGPPMLGALYFVMRSSSRDELDMLRQFGRVCQLIGVFPTGAELFCCSQFEIRPSALPSLSAVRWIAFRTNTQIQLNAQGLLISGPLEGIFIARKFMIGLLPVSLHFEKPSELASPSSAELRALERELDIQIGEKRRRKAAGKGAREEAVEEREFVVCTYEANLFNAYLARNRLLKLSEPSACAPSSSSSLLLGEEDQQQQQFPQDTDQAALMRSLCRQSLLAGQQPSLPSSIPFPTCKTPPFPPSEDFAGSWKEGTILGHLEGEKGTEKLEEAEEGLLMGQETPKSPDPEESPIAAGLLAGAKSMKWKRGGEFRRELDRERGRMLLKTAGQAIFTSPLLDVPSGQFSRAPNDFWSGFGFSSSLPAELLKMGQPFGGAGSNWLEAEEKKPRGRPIVGRGAEDEEGEKPVEKPLPPITMPPKTVPKLESFPNFAKSQMLPSREEPSPATLLEQSKKATALVHPRVAALQAGEQQKKPKFAMSAAAGLFDGSPHSSDTVPAMAPVLGLGECQPPPPPPPLPPCALIQWDIRALSEPGLVLAQMGLAELAGPFREQEIDMQAFLLLDEQCLDTLGVNTLGARRKIMHAVMKLRESARCHGLYSL